MVEFDKVAAMSITPASSKPGVKAKGRATAPSETLASSSPERETGTVRRVLMLLSHLADRPGESVQSLAARVNLPRSSVHRLLAMLRAGGFADSEPGGGVGPGNELYRIAGRLGARMPYRKLAGPHLQALSEQFRETSILALLAREQLKMFYAATGSPPDPMRYNIEVGALEPLVWGATARVLLAHLDEPEIAAVIGRRERSPALGLELNKTELRQSLAQIRRDGYGISRAHRSLNTVGVAAPFFDGEGKVAGSLGFLIPEFRWASAPRDQVVQALLTAAAGLTRQSGGVASAALNSQVSRR
jgi:IclR family transcriptional regulator, KDG regulon repressor